jgi:catechol 2,3-dioxygenase-like lactoylglutathione lyase family enzyme
MAESQVGIPEFPFGRSIDCQKATAQEEKDMPKLRHIAIAAKDPDAMAEFYVKAFDFKIVRSNDGPLAYGHHLSDGTIDLAILRFKTDQLGRGLDYTGLHHFGVLVEDVDEAAKTLESLGGRHYMDQSEAERIGGFEVKFYGPEGILFDVAEHPWTGTEPLPVEREPAEAAE